MDTESDNHDSINLEDEQNLSSGRRITQVTVCNKQHEPETNVVQNETVESENDSDNTEDVPKSAESETAQADTDKERYQTDYQQ